MGDYVDYVVLKFGGTSLKDAQSRACAYEHIIDYAKKFHVLVVVSAMGRYPNPYATDTLQGIANDCLSLKERDRLLAIGEAICTLQVCAELTACGQDACALDFCEAGIITDENYSYAKVIDFKPKQLVNSLQSHQIVIVGGFVGVSYFQNVTTLGRGGSDYSAALFAFMLNIHDVYIYSDVDGIYDSDPNVDDKALFVPTINYETLLNMRAKVVHDRCILFAQSKKIKIHVRNTFSHSRESVVAECY